MTLPANGNLKVSKNKAMKVMKFRYTDLISFLKELFSFVCAESCCVSAFSSRDELGLFLIGVRGLLIAVASLVSERLLLSTGSVAVAWSTGLVAPWCGGSSWSRDRTQVPCVGRWIPNHWTTREVFLISFPEFT